MKDISTGGNFNFGLGMNPTEWWSKLSFLNIRYAYTNAVSASYKGVPVSTSLGEVYREVMGRNFPAMTCVEVSALMEARARVEIEVTAVVPD